MWIVLNVQWCENCPNMKDTFLTWEIFSVSVVLTLKNLKFIGSMKKCELCYRWLTCIFSIEIHFTCLEFFRQVIYVILLPLVKTYVLSQSNFHRVFLKGITEQTLIRRGLQGTKKITDHKVLFSTVPWVFVLTLLLHGRVLIFK